MDDEEKNSWRKFQRPNFDSKSVAKRAKKAESATIRHARKFISKRLNNVIEVRRHVGLWLGGIAVLILTVGLQIVWSQQTYTTDTGAHGGVYAEATLGEVNTLNPLYAETGSERSARRLIFSSLLSYDTSGQLNNDIARNMTISPEGTAYTIEIKKNVKWHDGATLTAQDVAFTVGLIKDPDTRSRLRQEWQDVTVKVLNDSTISFTLPSIYAAFPHALTFPILPKHVLQDVAPSSLRENAFSVTPVGSGPFELRLLQTADDHKIINMTAYKNYFRGAPKLDRFEIHAIGSYPRVESALKTRQVSAAMLSDTSWIKKSPNYTLKNVAVNDGVYALINTAQPHLSDVNVRRALQRGLNVEKLRKSVAPNQFALSLPFARGQVKGTDVLVAATYDKVEAEKLLDAAGWKLEGTVRKKDGKSLTLNLVTTDNPEYKKSIEHMKNDWRALGIDANVRIIDTSDPREDFTRNVQQPRAYDVLVYELEIGADPDVYAYWHSSQSGPRGLNLSVYTSGVADDALTSARTRVEPDLRDLKYQAFAREWLNDVPAIGLFQSNIKYVSLSQSRTLEANQKLISPYDRYANVIYWTASDTSVYKTP